MFRKNYKNKTGSSWHMDETYLNSIVEQDHRAVKRITRPMARFKSLVSAGATVAGIELHHILKKGQHKNAGSQNIFE